jgi:hypothetical protein
MARRLEEKHTLDLRYAEAMDKAARESMEHRVMAYEGAVASSEVVICRGVQEVLRLCYSPDEIYATFYQRVDAGLHLSGGDPWDTKREQADTALFGDQQKKQIRFGALTLTQQGLPHYGECSLVLREEMIAHRASAFEENAVLLFMRHKKRGREMPVGHRAIWEERQKLAVVKIMDQKLPEHDRYAEWLLRPGKNESRDIFIEIHMWGPMTIRSFKKLVVQRWRLEPSAAEIQVVRDKTREYNVDCELP